MVTVMVKVKGGTGQEFIIYGCYTDIVYKIYGYGYGCGIIDDQSTTDKR